MTRLRNGRRFECFQHCFCFYKKKADEGNRTWSSNQNHHPSEAYEERRSGIKTETQIGSIIAIPYMEFGKWKT